MGIERQRSHLLSTDWCITDILTADSHPGFTHTHTHTHICQLSSLSLLCSKAELSSPYPPTNTLPFTISLWNSNWHSPKCLAAVREHDLDHLALNWAPLHHGAAITFKQLNTDNVTPVAWLLFPFKTHAKLHYVKAFFLMTVRAAQHKGNVSYNL